MSSRMYVMGLAVLLLAGCGNDQNAATTVTDAQVQAALELREDPDTGNLLDPNGCVVSVILNDKAEVDTYEGDTLATNRDGTVGVKWSGQPSCMARFSEKLDSLP